MQRRIDSFRILEALFERVDAAPRVAGVEMREADPVRRLAVARVDRLRAAKVHERRAPTVGAHNEPRTVSAATPITRVNESIFMSFVINAC